MGRPSFAIFDATAVTGVATFKSAVVTCPRGSAEFQYGVTGESTSTAAGTLKLEVNDRGEQDYELDKAAAGSEAANTTGWVQRDLTPTATIAITAASTWTVAVKRRFTRFRFSYTNASGSGAITMRVSHP